MKHECHYQIRYKRQGGLEWWKPSWNNGLFYDLDKAIDKAEEWHKESPTMSFEIEKHTHDKVVWTLKGKQ